MAPTDRPPPGPRRPWKRWSILPALFLLFAAGYASLLLWQALDSTPLAEVMVEVPERLSSRAQAGREAYDRWCVRCHGLHAAGTAEGPALVHPIYRPAHHGDVAFGLAVRNGVRAHHSRGADMPPQADVTAGELEAIIVYIRELQRANGIE